MQITVDDETRFVLKSSPDTIGAVLLEITEHVQSKSRAIQVILLNGQDMSPESLTPEFGKTPVGEIQTLEVRTASMGDLVLNALEEISGVIPELPSACHELAQVLGGDDPSSCFGQFNQFLDIWEVLKERQQQVVNLLNVDIGTMPVGSASVSSHNAELDKLINHARKCMEASDFPGLSDLLSHDLANLAEAEEDIILLLKAKV